MKLKEVIEKYEKLKIPSFSVIFEKASQYSKTYLSIFGILFLIIIYIYIYIFNTADFTLASSSIWDN